MSILFVIILTLFLLKLLHDSMFYVWLWQVKEYRMDRMMAHLKEDRNIIENNLTHVLAVIIFLLYFIFLKNYSSLFQYLILALFAFVVLGIIKEIKNRSLKRPRLTLKIMFIFFLLFFVYSLIAFCWISLTREAELPIGSSASGAALMLFIYMVNPLIISSIVLAIEPIFYFQKKRIIKKAAEKMRELKKVKVIGIAGSYGKTSTKEFLYSILSQKYKVVKTEGNNNTNIGVAYTVLNKVSDEYDYFICEMGAYKIGEIKEMCEIVKPNIGILTGINQQHIDLFGSQENIIKGKFELIEALPENGLAIINKSIKYQVLSIKVKNVKYFSLDNVNNIKVYRDYAEFEYKNKKLKLNLLGKHYIENVLSAIVVAECLEMTLEEIRNAIEKIKPTEYMMRKFEGLDGSVFIDDSYSANPDGVIAALNYIEEACKDYKKIIVFPGFIELGKKSEKTHKELFDRIRKICNVAFILNTKYSILNTDDGCKFIFEKDFDKTADMIRNNLNDKTVVLFESRGAGAVMGKLKMEKSK